MYTNLVFNTEGIKCVLLPNKCRPTFNNHRFWFNFELVKIAIW